MADTKISALTVATTPLAGTEVLPIVQSGVTKQVSVANLTAGRAVSVGTLVVGAGNSSLKIESNGANNFQIYNGALTQDGTNYALAQNYTGTNTQLNAATGGQILFQIGGANKAAFDANFNFVFSVAGKGVNFTANSAAAGMTSQLLNWYEEGTWTPNQGAGLTVIGAFTSSGKYTRIGRQVTIYGYVNGATNVAVAAGGVICTNAPYTSSIFSQGSAANDTPAQGIVVSISSATVYAAAVITASNGIYFTITYFV